jgi:serine protease
MLSARPQLTPAEVISTIKRTARAFPTLGGDNGPDDPTPVGQCRAPDGTDQFQCYCTTALCGAGMLDSGAAVAAVLGVAAPPVGVVVASTPMPAVGTSVTLDGSSSSRSVVAYQWSILSGAPLAAFASSTTDPRVLLNTTDTGVLKVGLMVTDASGATSTAETTIRVVSPPVASISPSTTSPVVGTTMTFDGSASSASAGRSIAKYRWAITSGSAVAEFSGGTAEASSSVVTKASGSFTVRLTVTDDLGAQSSVDRSIVVADAPVVEPPAPSGGGGAFSLGWILLLALATALLWPGTGRPDRCKR